MTKNNSISKATIPAVDRGESIYCHLHQQQASIRRRLSMPDSSCDRTLQNRSRKRELLSVWRKEGVEGIRAIYLHKEYHISDKLE